MLLEGIKSRIPWQHLVLSSASGEAAGPVDQDKKLAVEDTGDHEASGLSETEQQIFSEDLSDSPFWNKAINLAEVVCSRESIYRTALELIAFEIPTLVASATRNMSNFLETLFLNSIAFNLFIWAPKLTRMVGHIVSKMHAKGDTKEEVDNYLLFQMADLKDEESFEKAKTRLQTEEFNDGIFLSKLFRGNEKKSQGYIEGAHKVRDFFANLGSGKKLIDKIRRLKRGTILGESIVEGLGWGSIFIWMRLFRKYVLKSGFTGTKGYVSDKQNKELGNDVGYSPLQKFGAGLAMLVSPMLNYFFMSQTKDPEKVKNSKILQIANNQLDLTHGVYPKLGLMFSYIQVPSIMGRLFNAQGRFELFEQVLHLLTVMPSWWFGHRATNGVIAKYFDKQLAQKYNVEEGILVEPDEVKHSMPEPSKIQHVINRTLHDKKLNFEARKKHAITFYAGFALHSLFVFATKMFVNQVTKSRTLSAMKKKK